MNDDVKDLLEGIRNGVHEDFEKLKMRYAPLVSDMASGFEASGAGSRDDLVQEADSALLKAALSFDESKKGITFGLYAKVCIRNALISVRRKTLCRKTREESPKKSVHTGTDTHRRIPSMQGGADEVISKIEALLSPYEKVVFKEYLTGKSAGEIADELGKSAKSVSNAVFRIKEKVKMLVPEQNS